MGAEAAAEVWWLGVLVCDGLVCHWRWCVLIGMQCASGALQNCWLAGGIVGWKPFEAASFSTSSHLLDHELGDASPSRMDSTWSIHHWATLNWSSGIGVSYLTPRVPTMKQSKSLTTDSGSKEGLVIKKNYGTLQSILFHINCPYTLFHLVPSNWFCSTDSNCITNKI